MGSQRRAVSVSHLLLWAISWNVLFQGVHGGLIMINGLKGVNGWPGMNGIQGPNGLSARNGVLSPNGLTTVNGLNTLQGLPTVNGLSNLNGLTSLYTEWNALFRPSRFSSAELGSNWFDASLLFGENATSSSSSNPPAAAVVWDNRHIHEDLKQMLCLNEEDEDETDGYFRTYFTTLIELAWPEHFHLHVCCDMPSSANATLPCAEPDWQFNSHVDGYEPIVLAPHFLTDQFGPGQQEGLTAALIAEFNVLGKHLEMDLLGHFDLGLGGSRFFAGRTTGYDYYLGSAWGNAFLDCFGEDQEHVLCQASREEDRTLGRAAPYFGLPMFTCSGESGYPTRDSGKACFSSDMEENQRDGCELVAAVGPCDRVCVGGFCGVNDPPLEHRGTSNVLYVYLKEYEDTAEDNSSDVLVKVVVPIVVGLVLLALVALMIWTKKSHYSKKPPVTNVASNSVSELQKDVSTDAGSDDGNPSASVTIEI